MTAEQFVTVLGLTESDGDQRAIGDSGQAMTRFQVHPCWVYDHGVKPGLAETWDQWIARSIKVFFAGRQYLPSVEIAMWFHLGHRTMIGDNDWDTKYAARFSEKTREVVK